MASKVRRPDFRNFPPRATPNCLLNLQDLERSIGAPRDIKALLAEVPKRSIDIKALLEVPKRVQCSRPLASRPHSAGTFCQKVQTRLSNPSAQYCGTPSPAHNVPPQVPARGEVLAEVNALEGFESGRAIHVRLLSRTVSPKVLSERNATDCKNSDANQFLRTFVFQVDDARHETLMVAIDGIANPQTLTPVHGSTMDTSAHRDGNRMLRIPLAELMQHGQCFDWRPEDNVFIRVRVMFFRSDPHMEQPSPRRVMPNRTYFNLARPYNHPPVLSEARPSTVPRVGRPATCTERPATCTGASVGRPATCTGTRPKADVCAREPEALSSLRGVLENKLKVFEVPNIVVSSEVPVTPTSTAQHARPAGNRGISDTEIASQQFGPDVPIEVHQPQCSRTSDVQKSGAQADPRGENVKQFESDFGCSGSSGVTQNRATSGESMPNASRQIMSDVLPCDIYASTLVLQHMYAIIAGNMESDIRHDGTGDIPSTGREERMDIPSVAATGNTPDASTGHIPERDASTGHSPELSGHTYLGAQASTGHIPERDASTGDYADVPTEERGFGGGTGGDLDTVVVAEATGGTELE